MVGRAPPAHPARWASVQGRSSRRCRLRVLTGCHGEVVEAVADAPAGRSSATASDIT